MSAGIAVIGAGSWGTALAQALAAAGRPVRLWARDPEQARRIAATRCNETYLPGVTLLPAVAVTERLDEALGGAEIVVLAVPTHGLRAILEGCAPHLEGGCAVVSAAKGFESGTAMTMSDVAADVLGEGWRPRVAAVSGPNIAPEIARGKPAATVVASSCEETALRVRDACTGPQLRFYSNGDLRGVEYGGALKNIVAIAAGVCDGIGAGDNGKAALITRGIAEMARLGVAAGARALTFAGLTGLGDCVVTCMSRYSRNRHLGEEVGRGRSLDEAMAGTTMVVEGVNATRVALARAGELGVDMPIAREVHAVLFEGKRVEDALGDLMSRDSVDE